MWKYEKKLQYPVNIKNPNPKLAKFIVSQLGGPDGEVAASMRYLSQRFAAPYNEVKGLLTDIGVSVTILPPILFCCIYGKHTLSPRPPVAKQEALCKGNAVHR